MNINDQHPFNFPFPVEISFMISSYLSEKELLTCSLVSKKMKELVETDLLWKAIALKEGISFSCHLPVKQQVKEYCCRFTQLFCSIFPQEELSGNWVERYYFMQGFVESSRGQFQETEMIQKVLDDYIANSSAATKHVPEKIGMLIQAGGSVSDYLYQPIRKVLDKIKDYALRDSPLYKKYRFSNYTPLNTEERQDLMHSLQILQAFTEGKGRLARSGDDLTFANIALQYRCYALAKNLIFQYTRSTLHKDNYENLLLSITRGVPYSQEELPHIEAIVERLLNTGAKISSNCAEKLQGIGFSQNKIINAVMVL